MAQRRRAAPQRFAVEAAEPAEYPFRFSVPKAIGKNHALTDPPSGIIVPTGVNRRSSMTPPMLSGSETYRADRRRDPTPINSSTRRRDRCSRLFCTKAR